MLRDEEILPPKSKQTFEAISILDSESCRLAVQKQSETGSLLGKPEAIAAVLKLKNSGGEKITQAKAIKIVAERMDIKPKTLRGWIEKHKDEQ